MTKKAKNVDMTRAETAEARANILSLDGKSLGFIRAVLVVEGLVDTNSEAVKVTKRVGLTSTVKRGFKARYYGWLAEEPRTKAEATEYIMADESENVKKNISAHLSVYELSASIWANKA